MAAITFDEVALRYNTVPLATFDTLEECEDFYTEWVPIMADRMSAGTVKGIKVVFSDRAVYQRVALANLTKQVVQFYRCYLRTNLDYRPELPRELIIHEVAHLLTPGHHGPHWRAMVSGWGGIPSRKTNVRASDLGGADYYYIKCPECGAEWKRLRKQNMHAEYICSRCGYDELRWKLVCQN